MKEYKIFLVCTSPDSVRAILHPKIVGLSKNHFSVTVISAPDAEAEVLVPEGVKFIPVNIPRSVSPFLDLAALFKLWRIFLKNKPHIVHTRTAKAGFLGRLAAFLAGVPIIIHTTHGLPFYPGQNIVKYNFYKSLEKFSAKISDIVFSQNKEDLQRLVEEKITENIKTAYEGNGVDIKMIREYITEEKKQKIRKEFNLEDKELMVVSVSRLEPVKRLDKLLEVMSKIKTNIKWKCLIVGRGPLLEEIKKLSHKFKLENKVYFTGWRDDTWDIINAADIVVLTSDKEGIPRSIMEAMALGKPVVATNVLGTRELVRDGQTGILKDVNDIEGLARSVEQLLNDNFLRSKFGEAGAKVIENEFEESQVLERLIAVYDKLLNQKNLM